MGNGINIKQQKPPYKLFVRQYMCPGDALVVTAAVESLHRAYPGQFLTHVETTAQAIWDNNPRLTKLNPSECHIVDVEYPSIHELSRRQVHFMQACCEYLGKSIGRGVPLLVKHPLLYLSVDEDTNRLHGTEHWELPYCVINAGHKLDYTAKFGGWNLWQKVVDHFKGRLAFVQVGEESKYHIHRPLEGAINFVGLTRNYRDLFRLCRHSLCGVGPVSMLLHVYGALEKPYVALAGGREEVTWEAYSTTQYLHTLGQLDCCKEKACWKSRTVALNDGAQHDHKLCELPVLVEGGYVPKCLQMIGADGVIASLEQVLRSAR